MDFFSAMEVTASGLSAQRTRMNVASSNLANANSSAAPDGEPYRRLSVRLQSKAVEEGSPARGVRVDDIVEDQAPPQLEYDPGHPDADADGYVAYPNVNTIEEMVDMITASRAYEAGVTALTTAVSLAERAISIGGR